MPQSYPIQGARKLGVLASGSIITSWELLPGYLLGIPTCPSHRLRGGPQVESCRAGRGRNGESGPWLLSPTPAVAGAAVMTVVRVAGGGGDLFA